MSFHSSYSSRFEDIYKPAIESIELGDAILSAVRVDERKTGDSIITEIVKGISQAQIVLADVSSMGTAADGYNAERNGNVMYELGLAHAVKSPERVIIVKDDTEKMLFDVSSIPNFTIDFSDVSAAKKQVREILVDRLEESDRIVDYKLELFSKSMTPHEYHLLTVLAEIPVGKILDVTTETAGRRIISTPTHRGIAGLRDAGIIESHLVKGSEYPWYSLNARGRRLSKSLGLGSKEDENQP